MGAQRRNYGQIVCPNSGPIAGNNCLFPYRPDADGSSVVSGSQGDFGSRRRASAMIFTRRFGALSARREFPSLHVIDIAEFEAQRRAELQKRRAAKSPRSHRRFRGGHPVFHRHGHA